MRHVLILLLFFLQNCSTTASNNNDKGTGGGTNDAKPGTKDNVVDADFEDVKEDKEKSA